MLCQKSWETCSLLFSFSIANWTFLTITHYAKKNKANKIKCGQILKMHVFQISKFHHFDAIWWGLDLKYHHELQGGKRHLKMLKIDHMINRAV